MVYPGKCDIILKIFIINLSNATGGQFSISEREMLNCLCCVVYYWACVDVLNWGTWRICISQSWHSVCRRLCTCEWVGDNQLQLYKKNYYSSNQRVHTFLLKSHYYNTPRKGRNGRKLLRRLKPTVGCNASKGRRITTQHTSSYMF
jgi:hypothetical protein